MECTITVLVPGMPSRELDANKRHAHSIQKSKHVKAERARGGWAAKACVDPETRERVAELMRQRSRIPYRVTIGLEKGAQERDSDNVVIWPKALRDGIADVLCEGWDGNWELLETRQVEDPDGSGFTRFEFELGDEQ